MKQYEMSMEPEQIQDAAGTIAARKYSELVTAGHITGTGTAATDRRTTTDKNGVPHVLPFSVDGQKIRIVCPYCGKLHTYDRTGGQYAGQYKARCVWLTPLAIRHGLYIETA
jgi:hypothetical protein